MSVPYAEVIGDPVAHSKSPLIHNFWLAKLGIAAEYRKTQVRPEELVTFLAERRRDLDWRGCNVTVPHKEAVIACLDRLDPLAGRIGAVNTIVGDGDDLIGHNSDAPGFMEPLDEIIASDESFRSAILIGAGGAARAIAFALADRGMTVFVLNRNPMRAAALMGDSGCGPSWAEPEAYDLGLAQERRIVGNWLIINATSLGMTGKPPLEFSLRQVDEEAVIYDIVYAPLETPLLAEARARGMRTIDGIQMLVGQAAAAFALFFGVPAPREHDAELRALLTA